jgi:hypothetical protein
LLSTANGISGSRDAVREAVVRDLLPAGDEQIWMTMIRSRNLTSHTYNPALPHDIACLVVESYVGAFRRLLEAMEGRAEQRRMGADP